VNKLALAVALALVAGAAQAKVIELIPEASANAAPAAARVAGPGAATRAQPAVLPASMSELPEPEVFAMMLVGVVLLGYRARRDSSEKFK
jgi:hypothetical protein